MIGPQDECLGKLFATPWPPSALKSGYGVATYHFCGVHHVKAQVCVNTIPADRTKFIKALRLAGRIELKQALDLTLHLERYRHSILVAGVDLSVAEHLAEALRETGAAVDVQTSSIQTPMLCVPRVNARYVWGAFRSMRKAS